MKRIWGIRPVMLLITHNFGRKESKLDVGKSGETTPRYLITWRIIGASKIATKPGQLCDVERMRYPLFYFAICRRVRNEMIKGLTLGF